MTTNRHVEVLSPVGVVDACPVRRLGIAAALDAAGLQVAPFADHRELSMAGPLRALVVAVDVADGPEALVSFAAGVSAPAFIALLPAATPQAVQAALSAGAIGVGDLRDGPEDLAASVRAGLSGRLLLPRATVVALAAHPAPVVPPALSGLEALWLARLAAGATVALLAQESAFSERAMHRRLRVAYARIGASNRSEAIAAAARLGLGGLGAPADTAAGTRAEPSRVS